MEKLWVYVNEPMNIMLWGMSSSRDRASAASGVGWPTARSAVVSASLTFAHVPHI